MNTTTGQKGWLKKNNKPTPQGQSPCLFASSPSYSPIKAEENNGPQSERFTSLKRGGKKTNLHNK